MNCLDLKDYFSSYYDGEINGENKRLFEEHIASCRLCAKEYESFKQTLNAISGIGDFKAPQEIIRSLNQKIDDLESRVGVFNRFFGVVLKVVPQAVALVFFFVLGASSFHLYTAYLNKQKTLTPLKEVSVADLGLKPATGETTQILPMKRTKPSVELRQEKPYVEVLPASANPVEMEQKIREIAGLSNGEVFKNENGDAKPGEVVVKIPASSYNQFVFKLRMAIAEAQKRRMGNTGVVPLRRSVDDLQPNRILQAQSGVQGETPELESAVPLPKETPIPEVRLIRVLYR